jgi:Zn-finger nucleic acid-binding protein
MNRVNFARCSGVVVDVCKGHGTWFDRNELQRIIDFIRGGGLTVSRSREKRELEEERQRLRQEQLAAALHHQPMNLSDDRESRRSVVQAAGELLKLILD